MPDNDQPMWPAADEDTSSNKGRKTDRLPLPDPPASSAERPAVPNVTEDRPGSWFKPNVAPEVVPGLNAPAPTPPTPPTPPAPAGPRPDFADRLGGPRSGPQPVSRPVPQLPQEVRVPRPEPKNGPGPAEQSTQQMPVKQPEQAPWVPVERNVWPTDQQQRRREDPARPQRIDVRETRGADRPAEPGDRLRNLPPEPPRGSVPPASAGSLARPMRIEPDGRRFEAEATVGIERPADFDHTRPPRQETQAEPPKPPEPPREQASEEKPPKKSKRGKLLLIGGLVLLLVAALGVAATRPQVSNRLGLPWAPNAPKGEMPEPVAVTRVLQGPDANGKAPTAEGVKSILTGPAGNSDLGQLTGTVVDAATGTVLWDRNSTKPLTPASTTKVLTTAAALLSLDHQMRLSTKVVQGADPGTVILVGGGDLTLTALPLGTDSPLYPGAAHVDDLIAQVKKANPGVKKVQLDLGLYKGGNTAPGWDGEDTPSTWATQMAPVMADAGRTNPKDNDSMRTANAATGLAQLIASKLNAQASGSATAPKGAKVLGEVKSPPLGELVDDALQLSDNLLAEAIARQVAIGNGGEASFAGGAAATMKVLTEHGFDLGGVQLSDGSGLSKNNKIPAAVLAKVLAAAAGPDGKNADTAKLRPLLTGLPIAGGSGTLAEKRFDKPASEGGKGYVRAKTGTLSGVNTLAGVVLDTDGRLLVFAMMSDGSDKQPGRDALDVLAATLRKCGCS